MNLETIICITLLAAAGSALLSARRRRLRTTDYFTERLHSGTLARVQASISTYAGFDDEEVYEASGGLKGLRERKKNASLLVGFLQALVYEGHVPEASVKYIAPKALIVRLYTLAAYVESAVRFFTPKIPHIAARMALLLYADLEASVKAVLQDEYPRGMANLNAVL